MVVKVATEERVGIDLTDNGRKVIARRYLRKGPDGHPSETVEEMFWRVAEHIAATEAEWGGEPAVVAGQFYELLTSLRFLPNSPTFTGAGTRLGQLGACFVLPVSDDMGKCEDGIFQTLRNAALIQQTGGGTGFSFSKLRPKGAVVRSSGGRASGPVAFMRVFDTASQVVSQGGVRRGANIAVLTVDHPDIEEFIRCKEQEGQIAAFNISVAITDDFMRAVKAGEDFRLVNPQDQTTAKTIPARQIFDMIVAGAHRNGEPGVLFLDAMNRGNPTPHLGDYDACNPCGEEPLLPYENCCLGSVNLARHVSGISVRWDLLAATVSQAVHFLDDVITANRYVPAVPAVEEAALATRCIGLGIMGLGDFLYKMRLPYSSEEARELAGQLMEFIRFHAMQASIKLAVARGPFPEIAGSIYDPLRLLWTPPEPATPYSDNRWGRPMLDWNTITEGIRNRGIRNATQLAIAPTGTTATVAGCEAYGCEPVYALAYVRHVNDNGNDLPLKYASPLFEEALRESVDPVTAQRILDETTATGSCQQSDALPQRIRDVFVVATDIAPEDHVRMQAALGAFIDAGISKTINFPKDSTPADVEKAFTLAWELGCKGLTVYVTGSREKVVLETQEQVKAKPMTLPTTVRPRPDELNGTTRRLVTPLGTAFITINTNGDEQPFEVFINVGKAGSETAAVAEAMGRLVSLILRLPSPIVPARRLREIVQQLRGIGGGQPLGFGPHRVMSLPDGIAQVLAKHLGLQVEEPDGSAPVQATLALGDICPQCGRATLVREGSCFSCVSCGYSRC